MCGVGLVLFMCHQSVLWVCKWDMFVGLSLLSYINVCSEKHSEVVCLEQSFHFTLSRQKLENLVTIGKMFTGHVVWKRKVVDWNKMNMQDTGVYLLSFYQFTWPELSSV